MSDRAHTVFALALVALVPVAPLAMWAYARLASEDRAKARAAAERTLAAAPPPPGATRDGTSAYEERAWEGESLVPITRWRFETAYRLPHRTTPDAVVRHYRGALGGWSARDEPVDCAMLSVPKNCAARYVVFRRGGAKLELNLAEYIGNDGKTVTEYGVQVSH